MGENEVIHIAMGWGDLQRGSDGVAYRRSCAVGDIYLIGGEGLASAAVSVRNGKGEAQAWHDNGGELVLLGSITFDAPPAGWTTLTIPLSADYQPGNPLHIRLDVPEGVDICSAAAE